MKIVRVLLAVLLLPAAGAWLVLRLPAFGDMPEGERLQKMQRLPQFVQGRLENSPAYQSDLALIQTIRSYSQGQQREPQRVIPVIPMPVASLRQPPRRSCAPWLAPRRRVWRWSRRVSVKKSRSVCPSSTRPGTWESLDGGRRHNRCMRAAPGRPKQARTAARRAEVT